MSNIQYWQERSEQRLLSAEQKALRLEKKLKKQFNRAYKNIESEIAKLYYAFAEDGALDYGDVTTRLTKAQKKQFNKDLAYFIENTTDPDFSKKLQALYKRARVTKLEAVKAGIEYEVHNLYVEYLDSELQLTLSDVLDESYYRTIFDIQQFAGFGTSFTKLSPYLLNALLEFPWSGKNYSEKIWGHVRDFSGKLENVLTSGIIQGKSNQKMAAELSKAAEAEYKNAIRLIRTETNFIANAGTASAYGEYGVNKYQFLATLDLKTSDICRSLDGQVFDLTERKVGINYPPMHPHCRSTTVPYIQDLEGTRIARGVDGKSYFVDRNMTYPKWYEQHVKNNPDAIALEKSMKNKWADQKQYEKYKATLGKSAPKSFDKFQSLKYNDAVGWDNLKKEYGIQSRALRKASKGLSSGSESSSVYSSIPKFIEKIDVADKKLVESKLKAFEKSVADEKIEHAYVILENGKTYRFAGGASEVHPEALGSALKGSSVAHNHPKYETEYSLSKMDLELMTRYQCKEIRGLDYKYRYSAQSKGYSLEEFEKAYVEAFEEARGITLISESEENFIHNINVILNEKGILNYERMNVK